MYPTNFTVNYKSFWLSLHYNIDNSHPFVNGKEIIKFKAKDSEIVPYLLCLDSSRDNMIKTGIEGYLYDFSVNYWAIAADKILEIHKYSYVFLILLKTKYLIYVKN